MKPTIANFNKINLEDIRADVNAALKTVGDKYGMAFSIAGIRFSQDTFTTKLTCVITNGQPVDVDKALFEKHCHVYGLQPTDFGRQFKFGPSVYKICGLKLGGRRFTIIATSITSGKRFKFNHNNVKQGLANVHS